MSRALPYPFFSPYTLPGWEDEVQGPEVTDAKSTQQMAELGFDSDLLAAKFLMGLSKSPWIILSSGPASPYRGLIQIVGALWSSTTRPSPSLPNDWHTGALDQSLSQELGSACCDSVLLQALQLTGAEEEEKRSKHEARGGVSFSTSHPRQDKVTPSHIASIEQWTRTRGGAVERLTS